MNMRETLLSKKAQVKEVSIENVGNVFIRKLYGDKWAAISGWYDALEDEQKPKKELELQARIAIASICDETGTYLLEDEDVQELKTAEWLPFLATEILSFNGMLVEPPAEGEEVKN